MVLFFLLGRALLVKTALFLRLHDGECGDTVVSQVENVATVSVKKKKNVRLVNTPGHPRVSNHWAAIAEASSVSCVVFVGGALSPEAADMRTSKVPVLVFCNKADLASAIPADRIAAELERELQQIRDASSTAGDEDEDIVAPGSDHDENSCEKFFVHDDIIYLQILFI